MDVRWEEDFSFPVHRVEVSTPSYDIEDFAKMLQNMATCIAGLDESYVPLGLSMHDTDSGRTLMVYLENVGEHK